MKYYSLWRVLFGDDERIHDRRKRIISATTNIFSEKVVGEKRMGIAVSLQFGPSFVLHHTWTALLRCSCISRGWRLIKQQRVRMHTCMVDARMQFREAGLLRAWRLCILCGGRDTRYYRSRLPLFYKVVIIRSRLFWSTEPPLIAFDVIL